MRKLILIKHSLPEIIPDIPAREWRLSETGRLRCKTLAGKLTAHHPDYIVASTEPKALETGQIVAGLLGKPFEGVEGLHEHDRSNVEFGTTEQFEAAVARFFEQPDTLVFGRETADEAHRRFATAVESVVRHYPDSNLAIIAHGTVISLFVARATGLEPFALWKRLGLPSFVVLSFPEFHILAVVERMDV